MLLPFYGSSCASHGEGARNLKTSKPRNTQREPIRAGVRLGLTRICGARKELVGESNSPVIRFA
eukprot:1185227-Prorocentrum_minimum.AAC.2